MRFLRSFIPNTPATIPILDLEAGNFGEGGAMYLDCTKCCWWWGERKGGWRRSGVTSLNQTYDYRAPSLDNCGD